MRKSVVIVWMLLIGWGNTFAQEEAAEAANEELNIVQWSVNHYYKVYQVAQTLGDLSAAKQALLDILVETPANDTVMFELARIYFQQRQYSGSAVLAQEIVKMNPDNLAALEIAAISFDNLTAREQAVNFYEKLYLKTDDFNTLYKLALIQYDLKRNVEALNNVENLLTREEAEGQKVSLPTTDNQQKEYVVKVVILNLKGMIQSQQGDKEAARKTFEEALAIAPDFAGAKSNLDELDK